MKVNFTLRFFAFLAIQLGFSQNLVLDPSFGVNGKVITTITDSYTTEISSMEIQPDGKIVSCGRAYIDTNLFVFLCRYYENGSLDTTFGVNGISLASIPQNTDHISLHQVKILGNNQILVVGSQYNLDDTIIPYIVRFDSDGSLDTTFGSNGTLLYGTLPAISIVTSVCWYPDGKILLIGKTKDIVTNETDVFVARILQDYTLDASFGNNGYMIYDCGSLSSSNTTQQNNNRVVSAILSDGSLLIAGSTYTGTLSDFFLLKLNSNGTVDANFGNQGMVWTDFSSVDSVKTLMVLNDGKIILAGGRYPGGIACAKYNANGSLDAAFADNGKLSVFFNAANGYYAGISAVASQIMNGNLVFTCNSFFTYDQCIVQASVNYLTGVLNTDFGTNGFLVHNFTYPIPDPYEAPRVSLLQNDGKLLIGGLAQMSYQPNYLILLRYQDASLTTTETIYSELKIYPNPFQNQITIDGFDSPEAIIEMYDVSGRKLSTSLLQNDYRTIISMDEGLSTGNYFLRITTDQKSKTYKIVKQ